MEFKELTRDVIHSAIKIHKAIGQGALNVYMKNYWLMNLIIKPIVYNDKFYYQSNLKNF